MVTKSDLIKLGKIIAVAVILAFGASTIFVFASGQNQQYPPPQPSTSPYDNNGNNYNNNNNNYNNGNNNNYNNNGYYNNGNGFFGSVNGTVNWEEDWKNSNGDTRMHCSLHSGAGFCDNDNHFGCSNGNSLLTFVQSTNLNGEWTNVYYKGFCMRQPQ